MTNAEKRAAALAAIAANPTVSSRELAKQTGLSHTYFNRLRSRPAQGEAGPSNEGPEDRRSVAEMAGAQVETVPPSPAFRELPACMRDPAAGDHVDEQGLAALNAVAALSARDKDLLVAFRGTVRPIDLGSELAAAMQAIDGCNAHAQAGIGSILATAYGLPDPELKGGIGRYFEWMRRTRYGEPDNGNVSTASRGRRGRGGRR